MPAHYSELRRCLFLTPAKVIAAAAANKNGLIAVPIQILFRQAVRFTFIATASSINQ